MKSIATVVMALVIAAATMGCACMKGKGGCCGKSCGSSAKSCCSAEKSDK